MLGILKLQQTQYVYGMVIGTIAIIENPKTDHRITDSLHATIKHLRTHTSSWFWIRGLAIFVIHDFISDAALPALFPAFCTNNAFGQRVRDMVIATLLVNWQATWVHMVITKSSPKHLYQRLLDWNIWIQVLPITFLDALGRWAAFTLSINLELLLLDAMGTGDITHSLSVPGKSPRVVLVGLVPRLMKYLVSTITRIVFVRIAASMLDGDDESIVPLDPSLRNTHRRMGIADAWGSADRAFRARVWKIEGRAFVLGAGITLLGTVASPSLGELLFLPPLWFDV